MHSSPLSQEQGIEYLSIFLEPPSIDEYNTRLRAWLSENDQEVEMRVNAAKEQIEAAKKTVNKKAVPGGGIVFDYILENGDVSAHPALFTHFFCLYSALNIQ